MYPSRHFTENDLAIIRTMMAEGYTLQAIADRIGRGRTATRKFARRNGIFNPRSHYNPDKPSMRAKALLLANPSRSNQSIAAEVGGGYRVDLVASVRSRMRNKLTEAERVHTGSSFDPHDRPSGHLMAQYASLPASELAKVKPAYLAAARRFGIRV